MAVPLSLLANTKLLISKPFLDQLVVDIFMSRDVIQKSEYPKVAPLLSVRSQTGVLATNDLSSLDSGASVVFYHTIKGLILSYPRWSYSVDTWEWYKMFSTMEFVQNLKKAEASSNVIAHFIHINSGGGEAWMLDVAAAAMRECKKPIYAFVEGVCCSAAYYLAANAQVIKSFTQNDTIGSIGSMVSYIDMSGWMEQMGIKHVEEYATRSDLKNKKERDMTEGSPAQFITEVLDPVQAQFEAAVKLGRPVLATLPEDHPALRGETFSATEAINIGLIDGILPDLGAAISEAHQLGVDIAHINSLTT